MAEGLVVPQNIDNCLRYCTVFMPEGPEKTREIVRLCIESACLGPVVKEQIVDVSAYKAPEWQTTVDHEYICGTNEGTERAGPESWDGSPVATERVISQEELRKRWED